jgi:hypothetical protein
VLLLIQLINIFLLLYNILIMSNNFKEGEFYINQRKNQEKCLSKDLDIIEGFTVVSRQAQKKNPSNFYIPDGSDPGQTVMCQPDKIRYIRISQTNNYLTIQEVQVFDESGRNVAIHGGYSNDYELTQGFCRKTTNQGVGVGTPGSVYKGDLTTAECEQNCSTGCSAYEIQNEGSTEGLNPGCWIYQDPTVKGDGNKNAMCRVKQRETGTPIATMSSYYKGTNPYMAIDGNISNNQPWPNSACTAGTTGGWWEVDLGRAVNVKKVVVYNRPDCCQDRLSGAQLTVIDSEHRTVLTKTLNSNRKQVFNIGREKKNCGGPVIQKNMDDFRELSELRNIYNRQLQDYNQSIKALLEDSQHFVNASNNSNNKFANSYVRDEANGAVGYVTSRGVWKWINSPSQGNSIQGKANCPPNWTSYTNTKADSGQLYTIGNAPQGEIVKMNGQDLIKGSGMINNQTCGNAGQNVYVTNPSATTNRQYVNCSKNAGIYQSDLGNNTMEACSRRAADMGSNVFQLGPDEGNGRGKCYIGGGGGNTVNDSICSVSPGVGRMGRNKEGSFMNIGGKSFWDWDYEWVPGYTAYATYQTQNANNTNLGQTFHITDNLTKKEYPNNMISGYGDEFELQQGYNSYGNDIVSGSGLSIEQIKQKCRETPGAAGFYVNGNNYWIKNGNMWPKGKRQYTGGDLYVRNKSINNSNSCSNEVNFSKQKIVNGYANEGIMNIGTTCGLGTINERDREAINAQYSKLQEILNKIKEKIRELAGEDIKLNKGLMDEQKIMESRLKRYEQVYSQIGREKRLINRDSAMEEDATLNMLSSNKMYIIWSILALGLTFGVTKFTK